MRASLDLSAVPVVDNHAHALTRHQPSSGMELRSHFTEAHRAEQAREHVRTAVYYRWALRQIGAGLGGDTSERGLLDARGALPFEEYARSLVAAANIQCLLLDEGYPPPDEAYSTGEMASMLGVTVRPMLRIETLVQDLLVRHGTLSDVVDAFDQTLLSLRERGYVALKSIAAYRTGLQIDPPSQPDVARAFGEARDVAVRQGTVRIAWKPLNDFFVLRGLYIAAETGLPVQFHTGYGDPDLDLRLANPLHLRSLFEAPALQDVPIVLLHESYPFTAEAAFLAASYPNAYVDIAYSLPPLDLLELNRVTALVLGSAPASKVMVSSDGTRIPEHYWLGAVRARSAVQTVLGEMVATGEIDTDDAESLGRMVLNENALRLYGLTPTPAQADSISPSDGQ